MTRSSQQILDEWLVACSQAGDQQAFRRLLQRWQPKLYSYACSQIQNRHGAEDVTQEALASIAKELHKLKDPAAFPKWAYQILHRRACDWIKSQQRQRQSDDTQVNDEEPVAENDSNAEVLQALTKLDSDHYRVVRLFYLDGFSLTEISEILHIPTGTVKSRLFNGRQKLKELLQ